MDVVMPQLGETVTEGTIAAWYKQVGDTVRVDEPLFEVETDKVTMDIPAPAAGVLAQVCVPVGKRVEVGARLAVILAAGETAATASPPASAAMPRDLPAPAADPGRALSPVVRKLLAEHHIADPSVIAGSGGGGRITRGDVLAYVARGAGSAFDAGDATGTVVPMNRIRKLTAEHMVRSMATSPHVLQAVEVDFLAVDRLRRDVGEAWRAREGFALTYLPFVARAVCQAIAAFPHVNASVRGDALVVHHRVNLGIAVDLGDGLVAPVIADAAALSVRDLAVAIHRLADRARRGALSLDDLAGGSYTISNAGTFGTLITAPIIHQPQVAILSTDGVRKRAVVIEGAGGDTIEIRPVGVLAQCFDHRAFDGAYSAAFLGRVRQLLERANFGAELG
jgi:2-oxoglutarate dehydrogenase E2 component (dihydrolipoamide succinyltransferase)